MDWEKTTIAIQEKINEIELERGGLIINEVGSLLKQKSNQLELKRLHKKQIELLIKRNELYIELNKIAEGVVNGK